MAAPASSSPAPVSNPAIKVFVGNLSFKTRDADLQQAFENSGKVVRAKVIRDFSRRSSLGYGFVEMATLEDAKRAVEQMNKKEVDGRPINVELAKPRDENAIQQRQQQGGARRGGFGGRGRGRGGRGGRGGRPPRDPNQPDDRKPSKTTLFITNLPFNMEDAAFSKLFADHKLPVKKAAIVKRQTGRSKGFGFAEFENEESQQKALAALNGQELEGRKIVVKVAFNELRDPATPANAAPQQPAQQGGKQEAAPQQPQQQQKPAAPAQQPAQPAAAAAAKQPAAQQEKKQKNPPAKK